MPSFLCLALQAISWKWKAYNTCTCAVRRGEIALAQGMDESEIYSYAKQLQVPFDLMKQTAQMGRLPVVNFAAGGIGKSPSAQAFLIV